MASKSRREDHGVFVFRAHAILPFSTTSGNVTDDIILQYLELHSCK